MCAKNLLHSLYQYKAWSEDVLFRCLQAPAARSFPVEMEKACYWLRHINIVDQLFIARLQGKPEEFDDVVTEQHQDIRQLEEAFTKANNGLLTTQNQSLKRSFLSRWHLSSRTANPVT